MFIFPFMSRDKRERQAPKSRGPSKLEQQLFGLPSGVGMAGEKPELGTQDWRRSSNDLRDGCEVLNIELDTLPAELAESFRR